MNGRGERPGGASSGAGWWAVLTAVLGVAAAWPWFDARPAVVLLDALVAALLVTAGGAVARVMSPSVSLRWTLRAAGIVWVAGGLAAWSVPAAQVAAVVAVGVQWALQCRALLVAGDATVTGTWAFVLPVTVAVAWPAVVLVRAAGLMGAVYLLSGLVAAVFVAAATLPVLMGRPARGGLTVLAGATSSAAVLSVVLLAATGAARSTAALDVIVALLTLAAPGAILLAALRRRQLRAEVAEVLVRVSHPLTVAAVRDAVVQVLGDAGASLHYRPMSAGAAAVPAFVRVGPPPDGRKRMRVDLLVEGGETVAYVEGNEASRHSVFEVLAQVCAPVMRNARLREAEVARLDEVTISRSRIVAAALEERRRLERDLHDGAQQRLLAVSARLGLARAAADTAASLAAIDAARDQLRETLSELRALAREVHPAVLEAAGIAAALEMSAGRLGVAVEVTTLQERHPPYVETAAYLTVHELLSDAVAAGGLTYARVDLCRSGPVLRVVLTHDGAARPDAPAAQHAGDRLRALGGSLRAIGVAGTVSIVAEVPCA